MKNKIIPFFLILIGSAHLFGQDKIINNIQFVKTSIKNAVSDSLMTNAIPKEKTYRIIKSGYESKTLFVLDAVEEALDEMGYTTILDDDADSLTNISELKILNPKINIKYQNGMRYISGSFKLLLYSNLNGNINWGKEMELSFMESDSIEGMDRRLLEEGAPDYLKSNKEITFSSNKIEKILAGVIAGIITYLFYSVRS